MHGMNSSGYWRTCMCCLIVPLLNAQPAFFRKDVAVGDGPGPAVVADFNNDGRPDLAFRNWGCRLPSALVGPYQRCPTGTVGGVMTVLLNAGGGNFSPPVETVIDLDVPFDAYPPLAADLNGDGNLDLIGTSLGSTPGVRAVFYLPGRGNGSFLQPREIGPGSPVATGDFNGDHIADLLVAHDGRLNYTTLGLMPYWSELGRRVLMITNLNQAAQRNYSHVAERSFVLCFGSILVRGIARRQ
jgi:hypothetical protein